MKIEQIPLGDGAPIVLIAGLNVIENEKDTLAVARLVREIAERHELPLVFKASFDKANRSSFRSYRGPGLDEGLRIRGRKGNEEELVARALSRAGLRPPERFFRLYPHEISGGQRQRVVIAGAMVMEPALLLADEPVASLDASIRGEILALLRGLVDDTGLTVLVVTHDLGLAWNIADRIAVMYLGRIVETGLAEELLADPQHPVRVWVASF